MASVSLERLPKQAKAGKPRAWTLHCWRKHVQAMRLRHGAPHWPVFAVIAALLTTGKHWALCKPQPMQGMPAQPALGA